MELFRLKLSEAWDSLLSSAREFCHFRALEDEVRAREKVL
jgi:hypothetical protein